jgi:hypothetical protein
MRYIIHPACLSAAFHRPVRTGGSGLQRSRRFRLSGTAGQPAGLFPPAPGMLAHEAGDPVADYRNVMVALWAARRLRLDAFSTRRYARDLLIADRQEPGFGDVARKVVADFRRAGLIACGREVRRQIMVAQNAAMRSLLSPA